MMMAAAEAGAVDTLGRANSINLNKVSIWTKASSLVARIAPTVRLDARQLNNLSTPGKL